mmetsp:Transcript_21450/g.29811  ORF Transcript_21450/g.29811 Transcript_21450/m.29811 type:complete len:475 (+) Transcript_21450:80-1504(+)
MIPISKLGLSKTVLCCFTLLLVLFVSVGRGELDGFEDDVDLLTGEEQINSYKGSKPESFAEESGSTTKKRSKDAKTNTRIDKVHQSREIEWDEDEFDGIPPSSSPRKFVATAGSTKKDETSNNTYQWLLGGPATPQKHYYYEMILGVFFLIYVVNYLLGSHANNKLAFQWVCAFGNPQADLASNFHLLGHNKDPHAWGETPLTKESAYEFKLYASGRHYCKFMTATLSLKKRHDLYSYLWNLIFPAEDTVSIDVAMNDESMEPLVFAVARTKKAKAMMKDCSDLGKLATVLEAPDRRKQWVSPKFSVMGESLEVAESLLVDSVIENILSEKAQSGVGRYFQWMHFTDQCSSQSLALRGEAKVLSFCFSLPKLRSMEEHQALIRLVPRYIDAVARLVVSAAAKNKAIKARAQVEEVAFKSTYHERQQAVWRRKADKKAAEEEAESNMSREAIRKKEERERRRQLKKSEQKMKLVR